MDSPQNYPIETFIEATNNETIEELAQRKHQNMNTFQKENKKL